MNRNDLETYLLKTYPAEVDFPWARYPNYEVFRHPDNRKWFALMMDVPRNKLGLAGEERLDVVNVKCDPILLASLQATSGFFPAYHMSKASWITAALDGSVPEETLKMLLERSFAATAGKGKKRSNAK